jgi:hypothetical protein
MVSGVCACPRTAAPGTPMYMPSPMPRRQRCSRIILQHTRAYSAVPVYSTALPTSVTVAVPAADSPANASADLPR